MEGHGVRLEPLGTGHTDALIAAAADGRLYDLWYTSVPFADQTTAYIADALEGLRQGHMSRGRCATLRPIPSWAPPKSRHRAQRGPGKIGWTWYSASRQRSHINSACKLLLLPTASTRWVVRWWASAPTTSTSAPSVRSRRWAPSGTASSATTSLRDGSVRDSYMYSILASEWPPVRRNLEWRLSRERE